MSNFSFSRIFILTTQLWRLFSFSFINFGLSLLIYHLPFTLELLELIFHFCPNFCCPLDPRWSQQTLHSLCPSVYSQTPRLLWCSDDGRHPPPSHLSQPGHAHREPGQREQRGVPQQGGDSRAAGSDSQNQRVTVVVLVFQVIARRKEASGKVKFLLHWTPEDMWVFTWFTPPSLM